MTNTVYLHSCYDAYERWFEGECEALCHEGKMIVFSAETRDAVVEEILTFLEVRGLSQKLEFKIKPEPVVVESFVDESGELVVQAMETCQPVRDPVT